MTPTDKFVETLTKLKTGELGLLRMHIGQGLDESIPGFDLFTGIWWPLREKNQRAPRREVAWLVTKLFAFAPTKQKDGLSFASLVGKRLPDEEGRAESFRKRFDDLLILPLERMEPALQWGLRIADAEEIDWVRLTDDLSIWERESTRLKWADEFLATTERKTTC